MSGTNIDHPDIVSSASNTGTAETIINVDSGTQVGNKGMSDFKKNIIKTLIQPTYLADIKDSLAGRYMWRKISDRVTGVAKILIIISGIFAFAGAKFTEYWWLAFIAGALNVLTTSMFHYAMYASHESKNCTDDTNILLKSLKLAPIPDIEQNQIDDQDK